MSGRAAIAGAAVALALAVGAPAAVATTYVALGDSVAAGGGASSSARGYVGLLGGRYEPGLGVDEVRNRAVSGATSTSLISSGQLATAIADIDEPGDTAAVTIDIGGNDYLSGQCRDNWDDSASCPFRPNLASILGQLKAALADDPGAEDFAVMAYYNPGVGTADQATYDTALFGANHVVGLADTGADVGGNDVIYQEAAELGIPVADPYPAFLAGGPPLMSGDGIHPSDAGHVAIARAFCDVSPSDACGDGEFAPPPPPPPLDETAPQTRFAKRPQNHGAGHTAIYRIDASEPFAYAECRLDRQEWRRCPVRKRIRHLAHGRHTFRARVTDAALNEDPTPVIDRFELRPAS